MFFVQVVRGRPDGRLQFSGGGSKMDWLASVAVPLWGREGGGSTAPVRNRGYAPNLAGPKLWPGPPNLAVLLTHRG